MVRVSDDLELLDDDEVPASGRAPKVDWDKITAKARRNPTKWVKVPVRMEASVVGHINKGRYASVPAEEFEAISRDNSFDPVTGARSAVIYVKVRR